MVPLVPGYIELVVLATNVVVAVAVWSIFSAQKQEPPPESWWRSVLRGDNSAWARRRFDLVLLQTQLSSDRAERPTCRP
jgi:hypothetical protein